MLTEWSKISTTTTLSVCSVSHNEDVKMVAADEQRMRGENRKADTAENKRYWASESVKAASSEQPLPGCSESVDRARCSHEASQEASSELRKGLNQAVGEQGVQGKVWGGGAVGGCEG